MNLERLRYGLSMPGRSLDRRLRAWLLPRLRLGMVGGLVVLLVGCSAAYRDPSARTVGQATDDVAIATKVKSLLLADRRVSGLRINVDVRSRVVILRGTVNDAQDAAHAVAIAQSVKGASSVRDEMRRRSDP